MGTLAGSHNNIRQIKNDKGIFFTFIVPLQYKNRKKNDNLIIFSLSTQMTHLCFMIHF